MSAEGVGGDVASRQAGSERADSRLRDRDLLHRVGIGHVRDGGRLGDAKPTDLTRVNAGMSQTGTRIGGEAQRVKPGDIVIVPAGTPAQLQRAGWADQLPRLSFRAYYEGS